VRQSAQSESGFTLVELLVATAIFMVICAAMFGLLEMSQEKYAIETQMSGAFGEARLGLDQMVRDINVSGYPSITLLSNTSNSLSYAVSPVAWWPLYPTGDCQIAGGCTSPSDSDLILETLTDPTVGVTWIRYQLLNGVLYRGVVPKTTGDPTSAFGATGVMTPLVNSVVYNASGPLLAQINADFPSMYSAGQPPLFSYTCKTPTGPQPCALVASAYNVPRNIVAVDITLIVQTPQQDLQTGSLKLIELTGRGRPTNSGN
jgi:prepilin-type N-terminal cleavage/methylation domain-containing protein